MCVCMNVCGRSEAECTMPRAIRRVHVQSVPRESAVLARIRGVEDCMAGGRRTKPVLELRLVFLLVLLPRHALLLRAMEQHLDLLLLVLGRVLHPGCFSIIAAAASSPAPRVFIRLVRRSTHDCCRCCYCSRPCLCTTVASLEPRGSPSSLDSTSSRPDSMMKV